MLSATRVHSARLLVGLRQSRDRGFGGGGYQEGPGRVSALMTSSSHNGNMRIRRAINPKWKHFHMCGAHLLP